MPAVKRLQSFGEQRFGSPANAAGDQLSGLSVGLVHDWCPNWRGGERVIASLAQLFSVRDLYTIFDFLDPEIKARYFPDVLFHTSPVQNLPLIERYYRALFFLCPFLIEQFDVTEHDVVVSSSAAFARGIITRPDQPHICYVHSPVRYAWDEQFSYLSQGGMGWGPVSMLYRRMLYKLRQWDARTGHGPDIMVANSTFVAARIRRVYGRDARVIFPPVNLDAFPLVTDKDDYYVTAAFLAPYKRTDLVIDAFKQMPHRRLIVVGDGQQGARLKGALAENISFSGHLPSDRYVDVVSRAKGFVFAGCEDFGIAMAEAQAAGTPLIAFGRGGARDIAAPLGSDVSPSGVLFYKQSVECLIEAIDTFERNGDAIRPENCRRSAMRFGEARFQLEMADAVADGIRINRRALEPAISRRLTG